MDWVAAVIPASNRAASNSQIVVAAAPQRRRCKRAARHSLNQVGHHRKDQPDADGVQRNGDQDKAKGSAWRVCHVHFV